MDNFLDKFFFRSRNLDYISQNIKDITFQTPASKIFDAINSFSEKITGYNMKLEGLNKLKIRLNTDSVNFEKGLTIS